jgi:hypothetical protein
MLGCCECWGECNVSAMSREMAAGVGSKFAHIPTPFWLSLSKSRANPSFDTSGQSEKPPQGERDDSVRTDTPPRSD